MEAITILIVGIIIGSVGVVIIAQSLGNEIKQMCKEKAIKKRITVIMLDDECFEYKGKVYEPSKTRIVGTFIPENKSIGIINPKYKKR